MTLNMEGIPVVEGMIVGDRIRKGQVWKERDKLEAITILKWWLGPGNE